MVNSYLKVLIKSKAYKAINSGAALAIVVNKKQVNTPMLHHIKSLLIAYHLFLNCIENL